ncbi:MAG: hypothetical protein V1859_05265 [archaeon]
MRLRKEVIEKTACEYVGDEALPFIEFLKEKEHINEFIIAKKLKVDIHLVRHVMYKMNNHSLATYIRKKDREKGWYISYWTLNIKRFKELYEAMQREKMQMLKSKLKKEVDCKEGLYICPSLCSRMSLEDAMEIEFKCPECGKILNIQDNARTIERLREMIENMQVVA